jgi:hypothetical protein
MGGIISHQSSERCVEGRSEMSFLKYALALLAIIALAAVAGSASAATGSGLLLEFDENVVRADETGVAVAGYTICNTSASAITFGQSFQGDDLPQGPLTLGAGACLHPNIGGPVDNLGKHWTLEAFDPATHEVLASDHLVALSKSGS